MKDRRQLLIVAAACMAVAWMVALNRCGRLGDTGPSNGEEATAAAPSTAGEASPATAEESSSVELPAASEAAGPSEGSAADPTASEDEPSQPDAGAIEEAFGQWVQTPEGNWSFVYPDGSLAVGWMHHPDGNWYYFFLEGWMMCDAVTPDGYYVGPDGAWVRDSGIDAGMMRERSRGTSIVAFDRSSHRLEVWRDGSLAYSCVGTSSKNDGEKVRQGDSRTPLGEFYICQKNTESQYYKSLGLSYPDIPHAQAGLSQGIIGEGDYRRIEEAISNGATPPWDTPLGGAIMIHGERNMQDWSQGCITISNTDIDAIWPLVEVGTRVIVQE